VPFANSTLINTVMGMKRSDRGPIASRVRLVAALAVTTLAIAACGSDDGETGVPDGSTGNPYTQAIIDSDSHDEVVFAEGADMVVAVRCEDGGGDGAAVVEAVAAGLPLGEYTGTFEPTTGVDLQLTVDALVEATTSAEMTLDAAEYTVTFADIDGAVFTVRGC
jgi:hypothetical protein